VFIINIIIIFTRLARMEEAKKLLVHYANAKVEAD